MLLPEHCDQVDDTSSVQSDWCNTWCSGHSELHSRNSTCKQAGASIIRTKHGHTCMQHALVRPPTYQQAVWAYPRQLQTAVKMLQSSSNLISFLTTTCFGLEVHAGQQPGGCMQAHPH